MAQYLIAQWDYTAEGSFELSFKEGDRIKLLEKHNDDWWEGELNDEIGFFPANRTTSEQVKKTSTSSSSNSRTIPKYNSNSVEYNTVAPSPSPPPIQTHHSNPYLIHSNTAAQRDEKDTTFIPTTVDTVLVDVSVDKKRDPNLPLDWHHSHDESGISYYFNAKTGESQWERPHIQQTEELVYDISRLNLEALHPNWIRRQSSIQMKIVSGMETEISWKEYYAVLTNGFLLIYKEGLNKIGRRPSSIKPVAAFCTINLRHSEITPATKSDTRKKNAFIIDDREKDIKVYISIANETLYSEWLDAIMREVIRVDEHAKQQDEDLIQLLASISIDSKLDLQKTTSHETNKEDQHETKTSGTLTRWLSRSSRNSIHRSQSSTNTMPPPSELFGGHLKLEENGDIPRIVRLCIEQVDARGLDVVGIYRLSGQATSIQKHKAQLNSKPDKVNLAEEHDINVITGLLKLFFRELKNPLLTFEYYDRFIEAAKLSDYDERMFRLKSIIQVLPVANYKVLQFLARHLERVKNNSDVNKMEASNLALIFSIGLLRPKNDDLSASILHSDLCSKIIETIIMHVDWVFDTDTDDEISSANNSSLVL